MRRGGACGRTAARSNDPSSNGRCATSASTNVTLGKSLAASSRPVSSTSGTTSAATTSRTSGAAANANPPVPAPASSTRSSPVGSRKLLICALSSSRRLCSCAAMSSADAENRACVASACVSSDKLQCLLFRRECASGALFGDEVEQLPDLRPGRQAELVAAKQRLGGIVGARLLDRRDELGQPEERKRVGRPRLRRSPKAVDRARGVVGRRLGAQQRARVAVEAPRDRQLSEPVAEGAREPVVGRVDGVDPVEEPVGAAQCLQQAELPEPAVASRREPLQLPEDPLAGRAGRERRVPADELLRRVVAAEAQLVLEPDRPQQAQRICLEDAVPDRTDRARRRCPPARRRDRRARPRRRGAPWR